MYSPKHLCVSWRVEPYCLRGTDCIHSKCCKTMRSLDKRHLLPLSAVPHDCLHQDPGRRNRTARRCCCPQGCTSASCKLGVGAEHCCWRPEVAAMIVMIQCKSSSVKPVIDGSICCNADEMTRQAVEWFLLSTGLKMPCKCRGWGALGCCSGASALPSVTALQLFR